jgi:hypothetical protein
VLPRISTPESYARTAYEGCDNPDVHLCTAFRAVQDARAGSLATPPASAISNSARPHRQMACDGSLRSQDAVSFVASAQPTGRARRRDF